MVKNSWNINDKTHHPLNTKSKLIRNIVVLVIINIFIYVCLDRIANIYDVYGDGSFSPDAAFLYIVVINNISQMTAMYCLVLFYRANKVSDSVNDISIGLGKVNDLFTVVAII